MSDEKFMKIAIEEAKKGHFPFGAIIVKAGEVISRAHNTAELDPTLHAEVNAIRKACEKLQLRHLTDCTLYATCEPCPMCFMASFWARIPKIVYGCEDDIPKNKWKTNMKISDINELSGNKIEIKKGILKEKCEALFK